MPKQVYLNYTSDLSRLDPPPSCWVSSLNWRHQCSLKVSEVMRSRTLNRNRSCSRTLIHKVSCSYFQLNNSKMYKQHFKVILYKKSINYLIFRCVSAYMSVLERTISLLSSHWHVDELSVRIQSGPLRIQLVCVKSIKTTWPSFVLSATTLWWHSLLFRQWTHLLSVSSTVCSCS